MQRQTVFRTLYQLQALSMKRMSTIVMNREEQKFSAGHFTIFSATHRENLHGHTYRVEAEIDGELGENGLVFDYRIYQNKIIKQCEVLDEHFLLPEFSPYLQIKKLSDGNVEARFNGETLTFLARDVLVLPLVNISLEELARYFAELLISDLSSIGADRIKRVLVRCSSAPGQSASYEWNAP